MDKKEMRRQQLRRLVNKYEGMNNLAKQLGLQRGAYISQLLTDPPHRNLSETTARKWERILSLPEGWLDGEGSTPAAQATLNLDLLKKILVTVDTELAAARVTLDYDLKADLVSMVYGDCVANGVADSARIQRLVGWVKNATGSKKHLPA